MASAAGHRNPKCHVLNFFYDQDDGCALTILVNEVRFHIIADSSHLRKTGGSESQLAEEFQNLLRSVKHQDQKSINPSSKDALRSSSDPDSQDSGHGTSEGDSEDSEKDEQDSAVDVADDKLPLLQEPQEDSEKTLSDWMLSPFSPIFDDKAPPTETAQDLSVSQWYDRVTFFFSLEDQNGKLKPVEDEATPDLERRMRDVTPKVTMPKYIRKLDIPWFAAKDITVLDSSDQPGPYHPSRVRVNQETFFLKVVDSTQPSPTKREIEIMKRIEKLRLHEQMRVPLVKGLVGYEDSHTDIIGFLQTEIEDPTPLTNMLDEDIPQRKRDRWAKESERITNLLHEHNIIWGDAKADNFMVDKHDNLWIIDFGGSYTDGWVDPELMETIEGDDMGVNRIVNALHDPIANTWDPQESDKTRYQESSPMFTSAPAGQKRKAEQVEDHDDGDDEAEDNASEEEVKKPATTKRVRIEGPRDQAEARQESDEPEQDHAEVSEDENSDSDHDIEQEAYCICKKSSSGDMVACDNDDCEHQWFHFACVGLDGPPESEQWYCDDCKDQ